MPSSLEHPEGGTVALSAEVDDGIPWLVDHRILLSELENDMRPVAPEEARRAADEFRRRRGLTGRAQTLRWLAETGMSEDAFWSHVRTQGLIARVRERFAGEPARRRLAEHPEEFTVRHAVWVIGPDADELGALLDGPEPGFHARAMAALPGSPASGRRGMRLQAAVALTPELPEPLRALPEQASAGPVPYDGGYLAGVVHEVVPPDPEAPEVLDAAFQAWLDERRRTSEVRWFWL
ncbi:hypothetical protein ACIHFD_20260 [Nonomuraea sp. NPDC051941]|uniref:hypothetical protein n=1 Tax=Nonomuraea sp. NPDC051941 TaxID=3364373 RepID=UPI0037C98C29